MPLLHQSVDTFEIAYTLTLAKSILVSSVDEGRQAIAIGSTSPAHLQVGWQAVWALATDGALITSPCNAICI